MGKIGTFIIGLLIGGVIAAGTFWLAMPGMMLHVSESRLSFDETVTAIESKATANGWQVPKVYDIQASLIKAGKSDMTRLTVISLCQPDHAYDILSEEPNRSVSAMMPCRIGVFEGDDGTVYVSQLNMGMMAKMFGGTIQDVMGQVSIEEKEMLEDIIAH
ncbi:DUF302 domain-containing protein [candidate division GN15 bacterium]|nr:DUF302 domain-containing protein [candidate division GN15 bacterium]